MKKQSHFLLLIATIFFGSVACTDTNNNPVLKDSDLVTGNTTLNVTQPVSGGAYILKKESANSVWETFIWDNVNNSNVVPIKYEMQVDIQGGDFSQAAIVGPYSSCPAEVTEGQLNKAMTTLGFTSSGDLADLQLRVKETINDIVYYSKPIIFSAIGYGVTESVGTPILGVVGKLQGWNNSDTYILFSMASDGNYKGYINFSDSYSYDLSDGGEGLKLLTTIGSWDNTYGSSDAPGSLSGTMDLGLDNIKPGTAPGSYLMIANTKTKTWSLESTNWTATSDSWGVTGDITNWGAVPDVQFVFNETNGLLEASDISINAGQAIKFRSNNDWAVNYGDDSPSDGIADLNSSDNIIISEDGVYNVKLDMRNPDQVTYTLTKQ